MSRADAGKPGAPASLTVFFCHATEDKPAVRELYRRLSIKGLDLWLDEARLLAGQEWQFEIRKAVQRSHVVIVCLSRQSVRKAGFVQREIRIALEVASDQPENTIFLIPVKFEECDIPEGLRKLEWVNYFEERGYEKLMRALCERANKLGLGLEPGLSLAERERQVVAAADSVADSALYPDTERNAVSSPAACKPSVRDLVDPQPLPDKLARLNELAYNLFWTWEPGATDAFRRLDPKLWNKCGHNPVALLAQVSPDSLERAAESQRYLDIYANACRLFDAHAAHQSWPERQPVALFSMEFGLTECLPLYGGGLGVLSGDFLKSASECGQPMVGVGLLYRLGYFRQQLNSDGFQDERVLVNNFSALPVMPVLNAGNRRLMVPLSLPLGNLSVQSVAGGRRQDAALSVGYRRPGEFAGTPRTHQPALRRRRGRTTPTGDAARHRRGSRTDRHGNRTDGLPCE